MSGFLTVAGVDVTDYLISEPRARFAFGQYQADYANAIELDNRDDAFTPANVLSLFGGMPPCGCTVTYVVDGETIIDGEITELSCASGKAVISVQSRLAAAFARPIDFSVFNSDPATICLALLALGGLADYVDAFSFATAASVYAAGGVKVNLVATASAGVSLSDAIAALSDMGSGSVYLSGGTIYYAVYSEYSGGAATTITADEMLDVPQVPGKGREKVQNDYALGYLFDGNVPATDANGARYGQATQTQFGVRTWQADFSENSSYQIADSATAHFLGGLRMLRNRNATEQLTFRVLKSTAPLILDEVYLVTFDKWTASPFRLTGYETDGKIITVTMEEVL